MNIISKKNFEIVFYSTFFITSTNLLLLKISPQILFLFGVLPWLIIGICTEKIHTLFSYIFSTIFIYLLMKFNANNAAENLHIFFALNVLSTSILSFLLTSCLKNKKNNEYMNIGSVYSFYILAVSILLFLFMKYYYLTIDLGLLLNKIKDIYLTELKTKDVQLYSQLDELIKLTFSIFPAINSFLFIILTIINLNIATKILNIFNINVIPKINYDSFIVPDWCLIVISLNSIVLYFSNNELKIISLNFFIVFSIIYFFYGLQLLHLKTQKAKINSKLKFLLLFLLFIFFSYLLIIFLFFIGIINHIKRIYSKNKVLGE